MCFIPARFKYFIGGVPRLTVGRHNYGCLTVAPQLVRAVTLPDQNKAVLFEHGYNLIVEPIQVLAIADPRLLSVIRSVTKEDYSAETRKANLYGLA